jgi:hypothetical protein
MKKYILFLIILSISFLLIKGYINLKPEIPTSQSGGGGRASAFSETK